MISLTIDTSFAIRWSANPHWAVSFCKNIIKANQVDREPRIIDHYSVKVYVVPSSSNLASLFSDLGTWFDWCFYRDHEPQNTPMTVSGLSWFGLNANTKWNPYIGFLRVTKKIFFFSKKVWQVWQVYEIYSRNLATLCSFCHAVVWQNMVIRPYTRRFWFLFLRDPRKKYICKWGLKWLKRRKIRAADHLGWPIGHANKGVVYDNLSISSLISVSFHTVVFSPSFTGFGYLPLFTPFHHDDFDMGIIGSIGGFAFASPRICFSLSSLGTSISVMNSPCSDR